MTPLQRNALVHLPFTEQEVEALYARYSEGSYKSVKELCESHERLRAEAKGLQVLLAESDASLERLVNLVENLLEKCKGMVP